MCFARCDWRWRTGCTKALSAFASGLLVSTGQYRVVPSHSVQTKMEWLKQESLREDRGLPMHIALGRVLAASKSIRVQVLKARSRCAVAIGVFDLATELSGVAATVISSCDDQGLANAIRSAVGQVAARTAGTEGKEQDENTHAINVFDVVAPELRVTGPTLEALSAFVAARLAATGRFRVRPSGSLHGKVVALRAYSYHQRFDEASQVALDRKWEPTMGATTILDRDGKGCSVGVSIIDRAREDAVKETSVQPWSCDEDELLPLLDEMLSGFHLVQD